MLPPRALGSLTLLALSSCGPCAPAPPEPADADSPAPLEAPVPLPTARPWVFRELRGRPTVAAPLGCAPRAPTMQAEVPSTTGFVAEHGSLATLVVADATAGGAQLTGVGAMRFDAAGALAEQRPIPWLTPTTAPRLGRAAGGGWIATIAEQAEAGAWSVELWRDGAIEPVGEGDHFEAVDLGCAGGRCALLTPRLGPVARPGAEVRIGAAEAPIAGWQRVVIEPAEADSEAYPLAIAGLEGAAAAQGAAGAATKPGAGPAGSGPLVALVEKGEILFFRVEGAGAQEAGRIAATHGVLDVLAFPEVTAMVHGTPIDERGCVPPEAGGADAVVRFARTGEAAELRTPAPPLRGALRRLARGALATWIAPLGCGAQRRVVYAVVLDPAGKLAGEVIPVGDAERYAVASEGDDVDLWLQQAEAVTWVRLRCGGS